MIELGHAAIADGAVLRTDWLLNDAGVTELTEVERLTLRQIQYHLHCNKGTKESPALQ